MREWLEGGSEGAGRIVSKTSLCVGRASRIALALTGHGVVKAVVIPGA